MMAGVWTVARHTLKQSLRMKIVGVFVALLILTLAVLPFMMKGDGTLAGRIRTFLAYSTGVTSVLLSLVTIFLATAVVSGDLKGKQIFTVASKPLSRWQYVVGRWLGVVLLDGILLAASGGAIYAMVMQMRGGDVLNPSDSCAVETEIFTARRRVHPDRFDEALAKLVEERIEEMKKEGSSYAEAVEMYRQKHGNQQRAEQDLRGEIQKQKAAFLQSVEPGKKLIWTFSNIHVAGQTRRAKGKVLAADNLEGHKVLRIKTDKAMVSRLVYHGPVRVAGVDATVRSLGLESFDVQFSLDASTRDAVVSLGAGSEADIESDPTIQITYKPRGSRPTGNIPCAWRLVNPTTGYPHYEPPRTDPRDLPATITVSARVVSDEGKTSAQYYNLSSESVTILHNDLSLLYQVGGFGANFFKAMLLMMYQMAFLAALGTLAATFLSFPVACMMCLASLPFSMGRHFLSQSVQISREGLAQTEISVVLGHYILKIASIMLPNFSAVGSGDSLVEGMYIGWLSLAQQGVMVVALQIAVLLAIACLVFHNRELARIQT